MTDIEARTVLATEQNDITKRLFAAVAYREEQFVERLLRSNDLPAIDLNSRDNNGHTCLGIAATEGNLALVKLLAEVRSSRSRDRLTIAGAQKTVIAWLPSTLVV